MVGKHSVPMGRGEMRQRLDALEREVADLRAELERRDAAMLRAISEQNVVLGKMVYDLASQSGSHDDISGGAQ